MRGGLVAVAALVGLLGGACRGGAASETGPKWTWTGKLENAAKDVAVVRLEAHSYEVPKPPGAACLFVRAVHRPAVVPKQSWRNVVLTVTCEAGGVRRSEEVRLPHQLAAPDGIVFNLLRQDPLPAPPTVCPFEFHDQLGFPPDSPRDPIGVLCAEGGAVREGTCPGMAP